MTRRRKTAPQNGDCYQFPPLELDSWTRFAPATGCQNALL